MPTSTEYKLKLQPEGFYSVDPLPAPAELAEFYEKLYYQAPQSATYHTEYTPEEIEQRYLRARVTLHSIEIAFAGRHTSSEFLEVGCGEGFLLKTAHDSGYRVTGVDFSDVGLKRFNPSMTAHIETGNAFDILDRLIRENRTFDVCVLQNVLEHVIDPRALILQLRTLLRPGGLAVITVPNDFSRIQLFAKEQGFIQRQFWVAPPQHLHYFNTQNFGHFLSTLKFETLDSFGDFPIEFFLYHKGSNYVETPSAGPNAHMARVHLDLLLAENGIASLHSLWQAMTKCGIGRNITIVARPK